MRVNIGPYRSAPRVHVVYWAIREWRFGDDMHSSKTDWLDTAVENVTDFVDSVLWRVWPRGDRKIAVRIDGYDTWNGDHTLAKIIHPFLVKFRQNLHSSGSVEDEDVPEELRSTSAPARDHEWDTDDFWHQRWEWVLDEMIFAFSVLASDDDDDEPHNTVEYDRVSNGLRLFGKYFRSLWT